MPSFEDVEKIMVQNVTGSYAFNNLSLSYNFTEAFSELELEPKLPFKIKLSANFCVNKNSSETNTVEIKVIILKMIFNLFF
jgi:hypothetical protein